MRKVYHVSARKPTDVLAILKFTCIDVTKRHLKPASGVLSEEKHGAPPPYFSTDTPTYIF
jgi:hypothetical protein